MVNIETEKDIQKIISTGNWGCGAFRGDHELKFIQQWIAASFVKVKRLDYYTFDNIKIEKSSYKEIKEKYKTANYLYDALFSIIPNREGNIITKLLKFCQ